MYINLHTHKQPSEENRAIFSLYQHFETVLMPGYYSIGMHPWYIHPSFEKQLEEIKNLAAQPTVVAIGETGLDKVCKTDWLLQQKVFIAQLQLAKLLRKPLIIHCVRAWDEVLDILKKEKISVPVIFHGFNKNMHLAKRITDGGFYLSFGKALQQEAVQQVLKTIPHNRFFLETDDADVEIATMYNLAAQALSIEVNALSLQLQQNAATVFGNTFV